MKRNRIKCLPQKVIMAKEENHINLEALKEEFPFQWRVQSFSSFKPQATCIPYCTSRQVQDVLDSVCGQENWQDKYENVGGKIYCHIGIKIGGGWVWKSDCGTESNIEKEKGEASDAFKRAAVKWGIGRFLYEMRTYMISANKKKESGDKTHHLWCVDKKGVKLPTWALTDYINGMRGSAKAIPGSNPDAKGDEASNELEALEAWARKVPVERTIKALGWLEINTSEASFKKEGLASLPRAKYSEFCHLAIIAKYDEDLIDMTLEGFDYPSLSDGGMGQVIKEEKTERIMEECADIAKQERESKSA